ncbi:MAG: hypothetical protein WD873_06100 [Candidatus Hydrogenedentales bacterium]
MSLASILASDAALTAAAGILGTLWTAFQSRDAYRRAQSRRYGKAIRALEAGIEHTYRTYVRAIKEGRADGKLTEAERAEARRRARRAAIEFGRTDGINVVTELGEDYLNLWIEKLVRRAKNAG